MCSEKNNISKLKSEIDSLKEIEDKIRAIRQEKEAKLRELNSFVHTGPTLIAKDKNESLPQ